MHIQWFPGHMTKSLRMMEESIKVVDAVVYVLDSRAVKASINPAFDKVIGDKKRLYVLNKADLADEKTTKEWVKHFSDNGFCTVVTTGTTQNSALQIKNKLAILMKEKVDFYKSKGVNKVIRAMVIGVTNCGKSTIINSLCGEKRANTGDKAGVTVGKQWVKIADNLELLDTPGTLCPAFENQRIARHLAFVGSINDNILNLDELCLEFLKEMQQTNLQAIINRYGVTGKFDEDNYQQEFLMKDESAEDNSKALCLYEEICKKRSFMLKRGEFDYARCARAVIDDFRKGRLGKISLEKPSEE